MVVVIVAALAEALKVSHKIDVTTVIPAPANLLERFFQAGLTDGHGCEVGTLRRKGGEGRVNDRWYLWALAVPRWSVISLWAPGGQVV